MSSTVQLCLQLFNVSSTCLRIFWTLKLSATCLRRTCKCATGFRPGIRLARLIECCLNYSAWHWLTHMWYRLTRLLVALSHVEYFRARCHRQAHSVGQISEKQLFLHLFLLYIFHTAAFDYQVYVIPMSSKGCVSWCLILYLRKSRADTLVYAPQRNLPT